MDIALNSIQNALKCGLRMKCATDMIGGGAMPEHSTAPSVPHGNLVGRAAERERIGRLVDTVVAGTSDVLLLTGEAGIGKTALLAYAAAHATPHGRVLPVSGTRDEARIPFAGLSTVLGPLDLDRAHLSGMRRTALQAALALTDTDTPAPVDDLAVGAALLDVLTTAAEDDPVFLILDDVHLMDAPSVKAVAFAARRLERDRVGLLLASREDPDEPLPDLPRMPLTGLDDVSARELMASREISLRGAETDRVIRLTGGNPLALIDMPGLLAARAQVDSGPGVEPPPIGSVLENAYGERVDRLSQASQWALLMLALLPDADATVRYDVLRSVGVTPDAFGAAEDARLVVLTPVGISFRHPLVGSAVVQRVPASHRRHAHRLIAEAAAETGGAAADEQRAWHLAAAVYGPDESVAEALEGCAVRAAGVAGYGSAAAAYERSAQLSVSARNRGRRLLAAANTAFTGGQTDRARRLLDLLAATGPADDVASGEAVSLLGRIDTRGGQPRLAYERTSAEAHRLLPTHPEQALRLLASAFAAAVFAGLGEEALEVTHTAVALVSGSHDPMAGYCRCAAAIVETMLGRGGGEQKLDEGFADLWAGGATPPAMLPLLSDVAYGFTIMDRFEEAARLHQVVAEFAAEQGSAALMVWPVGEQALIDFRTGEWDKAYAGALQAEQLATDAGLLTEVANNRQLLTAICASRGQVAECHRYADLTLGQAKSAGAAVMELLVHGSLGLLRLSLGQMNQAIDSLERAEALAVATGFREAAHFAWAAELAEAYARQGRYADAGRLAGILQEQADETRRPITVALAARARGLATSADSFDLCFEQALAAHADSCRPFEAARTQLCFGQRLRRRKNRALARRHLTASWQTFSALGAEAWTRIAHAELAATGARLPQRSRTQADLLTPQELQVAVLAASGAGNREVAARLFISRKTVEYHLGHVYQKLGLTSRTELPAALATSPQRPVA